MTTVTRDYDSQSNFSVPVGRCNQQTSVEDSKCEEKPKSVWIVPGTSISKNGTIKISAEKPMRLYTVLVAPTLFY